MNKNKIKSENYKKFEKLLIKSLDDSEVTLSEGITVMISAIASAHSDLGCSYADFMRRMVISCEHFHEIWDKEKE